MLLLRIIILTLSFLYTLSLGLEDKDRVAQEIVTTELFKPDEFDMLGLKDGIFGTVYRLET